MSPFAPEYYVSRDGFDRPVPRQPDHFLYSSESGAYSRDSSRFPRRRPFIYLKPPYAIGSIPSLSGHAIAYRWRSLPRVHRHRASKPQGKRVLPWQVTMDQLVCASLSHSHYRHEVGMLEVSVTLYTNINHYAGIQKNKNQTRSSLESSFCTLRCVCVCFLPIHSGLQWTYQPGSHRRKVTQDFSSTFFLRCLP